MKNYRQTIINNHIKNLSKDDSTKVSASLFNQHGSLVAVGYNGLPRNSSKTLDNAVYLKDKQECVERFKSILGKVIKKDHAWNRTIDSLADVICALHEKDIPLFKYDFFEHAERNLIYNFLKEETSINNDSIAIVDNIRSIEDVRALISAGVANIYFSTVLNEDVFNNTENVEIEKLYDIVSMKIMAKNCNIKMDSIHTVLNSEDRYHKKIKSFYEVGENIRKDLLKHDGENSSYTLILKNDFSILSIGFEEKNQLINSYKTEEKTSATLNAIYRLANEKFNHSNNTYSLSVSLYCCKNCLEAIGSIGKKIKEININNSSLRENSNPIWKQQFEENAKNLLPRETVCNVFNGLEKDKPKARLSFA